MSTSGFRVVPSFHLKGIQPSVMLERYLRNDIQVTGLLKEKVSFTASSSITVAPKLTTEQTDERFIFQDKSGGRTINVTTNQNSFRYWHEHGRFYADELCSWCRFRVGENCVPVPLSLVGKSLFVCDEPYCSFQCCLSGIRRDYGTSYMMRDPLYRKSEVLLNYLFSIDHPGQKLVPAMDWKLLKGNGGPLSREEFSKGFYYLRSINLVVPAKICYLQVPGQSIG
nr:hypothetical protein pmam_164 [Pithovirus mammoth]